MVDTVYLRMRKNVDLTDMKLLKLNDIAYISAPSALKSHLLETDIYRMTEKDQNTVVIDGFMVIDHLNEIFSDAEFQMVGPNEAIIRVHKQRKRTPIVIVAFIWLLLFIGTAMTIMNFHYDVSMQEVQQKLHYIITGEKKEYPLWLQIPYSIGLGVGMLLFFNHWFKKRFNEEPSPLEVEIFNYQQSLDQYAVQHENKLHD
ncbi:Stage V sporulation protein AA [Lentibacillus sp. JNUCC-1]|uniref:stage V sporulation protein AA n=1 Tax=Lentibacillus sp. JNUCC-1 TaxID=2654513 RepID=UPI0012E83403|nr:stage V sporulation protein AA [Lentibacillus sp. JNUCC-1]MUV39729.1 Stage V sporulation protein AA [Lentibacillus sp. JNUCC-1]